MKIFRTIKEIVTKLSFLLSKDEKKGFVYVLLLSVLMAVVELLGVSVLVPLVQAFIDDSVILQNETVQKLISFFGFQEDKYIMLLIFGGIAVIFILKNALSIFSVYITAKFSCKVIRGLGARTMRFYMEQDYSFFLNTNVSDIYRSLNTDVVRVYELLNSSIFVIKQILTVLAFSIFLLYTNWIITAVSMLIAIVLFFLVTKCFRRFARVVGVENRKYSSRAVKNVMETFGGIKEILVLKRRDYFVNEYKETYAGIQKTQVKKSLIEGSPSSILEAILVSAVMGVMTVIYLTVDDLPSVVTVLAIFSYSAIRIFPILGAIIGSTNGIAIQKVSLDALVEQMKDGKMPYRVKTKVPKRNSVDFTEQIVYSNICWSYTDRDVFVIDDLSLTIKKGESIAFIGKSGAGKSTLVDIILGLFVPQKGTISIDNQEIDVASVDWSSLVGYVPQSNFLIDNTIRKNIAFGIPEEEIDDEKVAVAIKKAQLKEFVDSLPEGIETLVGERGARLSGGQRQRIVIARALYNNPSILVLDEATSALDTETETAVVKSLEILKHEMTLIVVAHRLSTIKTCDHIYEITNGKAIEVDKADLFE